MRVIALGEAESLDATLVGGKAANLARFSANFRVPPAFCLSTSVYAELKRALEPDGSAERAALRAGIADGYERLAATTGVRDPRVAVRSSATGEDSGEASYAGQHETILGVRGTDAVLDAVLECWRSAGNERVTAYRRERDIDTPVEVGVIVQQMVDADASAIAFGADPVSGDTTVIVIDAARGLGDKIASGDITPDRYHVRKDTLDVVLKEGDALSASEVEAVARLVIALERENGHPVDVECAFAGGELYLLQCRPITTLANAFPVEWAHPDDAKLHWRRDDAHYTQPVPRLVLDYRGHGPAHGMRHRAEVDDQPLLTRFEAFSGRVYVALERRPHVTDMAAHGRAAVGRVRARARTQRRVWDEEYMPRLRAHYAAFADLVASAPSVELNALADRFEAVFPRVNDIWAIHMLTVSAAYTVMDELAQTFVALTGGTTTDAVKLTQARAPALQRFGRDMHALVRLYTSGDSSSFERARAAFLAEHGHLGATTEDFREAVWSEDAALFAAELERRAAAPDDDPAAREARLIAEGEAVERRARDTLRDRPEDLAKFEDVLEAARATGPLTEEHNYYIDRMAGAWMGRIARAIGVRLRREGLIADAEQVFLFHIAEIAGALRERRPLFHLAAARERELASWRRQRHPGVLGSPTSPFLGAATNERMDLIYRTAQDAPGVVRGQPASSGIRRGRACLVRGQADFAKMRPGDVLVCRSSNVSWIPLFTIAAAVVTDVGGSLSHAAVVAREFGVPAVVGTGVAIDTLRDGQLIEVDGDRGTVRSLD